MIVSKNWKWTDESDFANSWYSRSRSNCFIRITNSSLDAQRLVSRLWCGLYCWESGGLDIWFILARPVWNTADWTAQCPWTPSSLPHALWRWESYWFNPLPKEYIQEWVDSETNFEVIKDDNGLFEAYPPNPKRYWTAPPSEEEFIASCNEFWWVSAYVVKGICRKQIIYATDHLYGICQRELLKVLAWQVARKLTTNSANFSKIMLG